MCRRNNVSRPDAGRLAEVALYGLFAALLLAHHLLPIAANRMDPAWWATPLTGLPLAAGLFLHRWRDARESRRLDRRVWRHDPRIQSPWER